MMGDGGRPLRIWASAGKNGRAWKYNRAQAAAAAFIVLLVSAPFLELATVNVFSVISPAFAAGKGKGNGKDDGNGNGKGLGVSVGDGVGVSVGGNGNGNGNGGGNGNGNGNANGAGNGNGNGLGKANGITNGNGLGIGLGDGVGLGIGMRDADTIGVGLGISVGGGSKTPGNGNNGLGDAFDDTSFPKWGAGRRDEWLDGKTARESETDDLDLGKQFDIDRIRGNLGPDLDELGKLLTVDGANNPGAAETSVKAVTKAEARAADALAKGDQRAAKFLEQGEKKAARTLEKAVGKGAKAQAKAEEKAARTLAKAEQKAAKALEQAAKKAAKVSTKLGIGEEHGSEVDDTRSADAARGDPSDSGNIRISPDSYVEREVLALGLSDDGARRVIYLGFSLSDTRLEQEEGVLVRLYAPENLDTLQALALLRRDLPRESFHLNRIYRPYNTATDNDAGLPPRAEPKAPGRAGRCLGDRCYSKTVIRWKDEFADCARDINVGVIDTDVDLRHPTFAGQKITRRAFLSKGRQTSPNSHGTGILALLAGRPDSGTPGLLPEAKFFVANIFFEDDNGETITDTVALLKSLEWMNDSAARLINMSFSGPKDELVEARLKAMRGRGFVFTAAAGNEGPAALPTYPAAYPEVVAVTAVTKDRRIYPSANRGAYVDLAAPGVRIWTALPNAREGYRTGTSFATPFATAVLALQRPGMMFAPKDELLDRLNIVGLGPQGRDPIYGRGLLQAPGECPHGDESVSSWATTTSSFRR